jgi:hypothetical protein
MVLILFSVSFIVSTPGRTVQNNEAFGTILIHFRLPHLRCGIFLSCLRVRMIPATNSIPCLCYIFYHAVISLSFLEKAKHGILHLHALFRVYDGDAEQEHQPNELHYLCFSGSGSQLFCIFMVNMGIKAYKMALREQLSLRSNPRQTP